MPIAFQVQRGSIAIRAAASRIPHPAARIPHSVHVACGPLRFSVEVHLQAASFSVQVP